MDLHVTFNPVIKEQNLQSDALDIESNIIAVSLMERPPLNASFQSRAIHYRFEQDESLTKSAAHSEYAIKSL